MTIQIRVLSAQARTRIRELEAEVAMLRKQMGAASVASSGMLGGTAGIARITKWGNQVQWAGRQLMYNFTLPIVLAGAAATKFALDNQKALTRVIKVYGDNSEVMNNLAKVEIPALEKSFVALSNRFGVAQADAINIAADWAAAGASGVALAKSVGLTMETMVLGEMNAKDATVALISIQAQYGQSIDELSQTIDTLNMVENQTGISMQGLVQGMARSAGVARTMGVDVLHLAAMMAALVPATGSATAAGNGLKTMLSRIMSPTNEANEVMAKMGINTKDLAWQSLNATQRLEYMAKAYDKLDDAQKIVVASTAASRWQINRFGQLMTDINNPLGYYHRSLKTAADSTANFNQRLKELNTVLKSNPQRLKQMWTILQNTLAQIIQPLIPAILMVTHAVAKMAEWFGNLSPEVQKAGLAFLVVLALIGPLARYVGAMGVLLGTLKEAFGFVAKYVFKFGGGILWLIMAPFKLLGKALVAIPALLAKFGPALTKGFAWIVRALTTGLGAVASGPAILIAAAIAGVLAILYAFRDKIAAIFNSVVKYFSETNRGFAVVWNEIAKLFAAGVGFIVKMFNKLPQSVQTILLTVLNVVRTIILKIYEWLTYLNPFAKHSPSLVDQVTKGMAVIRAQYSSVSSIGSIFAKAASDLQRYKAVIGSMTGGPFSDERASVAESYSKALPLFDALLADLNTLNTILAQQDAAVKKQQAVVDAWAAALDRANAALDAEEAKLSSLQDALSALTDEYAAHQQALDDYASAPIAGMGAMEDAIFANEMAQKKLRLEMMQWEDANGSIEDMQNNMAKLAGSIEQMQGEVKSLTAAGAGSDITGPMQDQIAQMQAAYDSMDQTVQNSPIADMQAELERLQRQGEELDLEKSLKFDELQRQIEQLANTTKELTFEEIVAGIKKEQDAMAALQPQIDAATKAVQDQQAAVDAAKASRDAIQATYDAETAKLDALNAAYDKTEQAVRDIESALNDMGSAASAAGAKAASAAAAASKSYQSPGAQNFDNAKGGNFPDVSGSGAQIGREGGLESQVGLIDKFTQDTIKKMDDLLAGMDMWKPLREKWEEFKSWWIINVERNWIRFKNAFGQLWTDMGNAISNSGFAKTVSDIWNKIGSAAQPVMDFFGRLRDLFSGDFKKIGDELGKIGEKIGKAIGPELEKFRDLWPGLQKVFKSFGNILSVLFDALKVVAGFIIGGLVGAFKIVVSILANVLGPAIDAVIGIFKGLVQFIRGVVEIIIGIFTLDLGSIIQGVKDIFGGMVSAIASVLTGAWNVIWGAVEGLVKGIMDWLKWLWDEMFGHSIIPDMINAFVEWFTGLPGKIWDAIISVVGFIIDVAKQMWNGFTSKSSELWNIFIDWVKGLPQAVWDKIIGIKDKLVDVARSAWDAFKQAASDKWNGIIDWVKGLAQHLHDKFINLRDKLKYIAGVAWDDFKSKSSEKWNAIIDWIRGLPQAAYDKFIFIKDKLVEAARAGFQALVDKAKEIIDGKNGFISWITAIPGRIGGLLGSIGSTVANAIKAAWNGVANWINDHGIAAVNKVTTHFGFTLGRLPTFEGGGVIPGRISKKDNTIIAARSGEGVIVPELVKMLGGAPGLKELNHAARQGSGAIAQLGVERFANGGVIGAAKSLGIKGFEGGGVIGMVSGWLKKGVGFALSSIIEAFKKPIEALIPGKPFAEKWTIGYLNDWQAKAKQWGDQQEQMGNGVVSPMGYKQMEAILTAHFGRNITFTSDYRSPSANRQAGGSATSLHMQGRAVDMTPRKDIFDFIHDTYGKHTAELFWTPQNGRNIMGGQEVRIGGALAADHYDHIHWGYDRGGILPPGMTLAQNGTGRNEYTLTGSDWNTLSNVVSMMDRITQKSTTAGAPGGAAVARMGSTLSVLERRLQGIESQSTTTTRSGSGNTTYNFYGDLEFPNVTNGDDAEAFIKNLKGLAS